MKIHNGLILNLIREPGSLKRKKTVKYKASISTKTLFLKQDLI